MSERDYHAEAARLLPCICSSDMHALDNPCPHYSRKAVAAWGEQIAAEGQRRIEEEEANYVQAMDRGDAYARQVGQLQAELAVRDNQITQLLATNDKHVMELNAAREDISRIHRLPEQEWLEVGTIVLQILASAARAGYPINQTDAVKAVDRGKVYVSRLRARCDAAEAEAKAAREAALRECLEIARRHSGHIGPFKLSVSCADGIADAIAAKIEEKTHKEGQGTTE